MYCFNYLEIHEILIAKQKSTSRLGSHLCLKCVYFRYKILQADGFVFFSCQEWDLFSCKAELVPEQMAKNFLRKNVPA